MARSDRWLIAGLGYSGGAVARALVRAGIPVAATTRDPAARAAPAGVSLVGFDAAGPAIQDATHLLLTAPPGEAGDPLLGRHAAALAAAPALRWIGYLSTTGVYGDRAGASVDETSAAQPQQDRSLRRHAAERQWEAEAATRAVDIFRTGGIYGPGRSAFDELRAGTARRTLRPGHRFGRIHRDDIALAVLAAGAQPRGPGLRILHLVDDEPAESAAVVEEAARLLGVPPPPAIPYEAALPAMSPMARSFWAEHRHVLNDRTKAALGIAWRYPSYREGLAAILAEEGIEGAG
jgi:nucleoside-diphosphate-sugar epimerase